jgi:hypothetical protein
MYAFLALPRQKPGLQGRAVFLYPRSGYKNATSRAFRCNPGCLGEQPLVPHGLTYALTCVNLSFVFRTYALTC